MREAGRSSVATRHNFFGVRDRGFKPTATVVDRYAAGCGHAQLILVNHRQRPARHTLATRAALHLAAGGAREISRRDERNEVSRDLKCFRHGLADVADVRQDFPVFLPDVGNPGAWRLDEDTERAGAVASNELKGAMLPASIHGHPHHAG